MMRERIVPYGGLTFVVAAALMLGTIIARSPDTHGHLWHSLPAGYDRTPLDTIEPADLDAIEAELLPFTFPTPPAGGEQPAAAGPAEPADATGSADAAGSAPEGGEVQRITLIETEYAIAPDMGEMMTGMIDEGLTLKLGVPVELTVTNEGKQTHGLWMADFGIYEDIRSGKTAVFKFTPDKPGRFRFTCSYSLCGSEEEHARMVGFLTVQ
jgi:heme/copper-type cytochrome/quinol oxidase subunit 2